MARQFGEAGALTPKPSGRQFGEPGKFQPDGPSLLQRRDAVSRIASATRQERNLYRRVFRGLNRRLRRGDTAAGQEAIALLAQARAAGIQMAGIPSANADTSNATHQLLDQQKTAVEAADIAAGTDAAKGATTTDIPAGVTDPSSLGPRQRRPPYQGPRNLPGAVVVADPNAAGAFEESVSPGMVMGPDDGGRYGDLLERRRQQLGGPGSGPIASTRDPNATPSSPGLAPIETELEYPNMTWDMVKSPEGEWQLVATSPEVRVIRNKTEEVIGRGDSRPNGPSPSFPVVTERAYEGTTPSGARPRGATAIYEAVESGEISLDDLSEEEQALYLTGRRESRGRLLSQAATPRSRITSILGGR